MDGQTNKIGLAGDWHGAFTWTRHALHTFGQAGIKDVFQLGDFSLGWPGKWPDLINICESVCKRYDMTLWVTPGNHENWEWIDTREFVDGEHWMTDHTVLLERNWRKDWMYLKADGYYSTRTILSLGGAPSIDFNTRSRGIDWFPTEMIPLAEAERAAREGHADIMLCHDSPDGTTDYVQAIIDMPMYQSIWSEAGLRYAREGRQLMNIAFWGDPELPGVHPKVFAHGHFHEYDTRQDEDTLWLSLGCNNQEGNLGILDLDTLEFEKLDIITSSLEIKRIEEEFKRLDGERRAAVNERG